MYLIVGEFTVKTQEPGVLKEDQESAMQSTGRIFTEDDGLQFQAEASFNTCDGVCRPLCLHFRNTSNHTLMQVTYYINA